MNADARDNLLERDDVALVIVDVQERMLPAIAHKELLLANLIKLVRFAKILHLPIIASEQVKLGPFVPEIIRELPDLRPVTKAEFDALKSPVFAERLAALHRQTLLVVGVEAHICVAQTVIHALPDYRVHVIADAIGSRAVENYHIAVERMRHAGAIISSTEMAMYELMERAGTDEFRVALPLVKE